MTVTNIEGVSSKLRLGRRACIVSDDIAEIKFTRDITPGSDLANIHAYNIYGVNFYISGTLSVDSLSLNNLTAVNGSIDNLTSLEGSVDSLTSLSITSENLTCSKTLECKDFQCLNSGDVKNLTVNYGKVDLLSVTDKIAFEKDDSQLELKVEPRLGFIDVDRGFSLKNSSYVTNIILGMLEPNFFDGDKFYLRPGLKANCSAGRKTEDGYTYQVNNNYIEVQTPADINIAEYKLLGSKDYQIWYDGQAQELFVVDSEKFHYSDSTPPADQNYRLWHSPNLNINYRWNGSSWVRNDSLIKVAEFGVDKGSYVNQTAYYPSDLLKSIDYLVANQGGGGKVVINTQHVVDTGTPILTVDLRGKSCKDESHMFVMVEHTIIPTTEYSINTEGNKLTFKKPVDPGLGIELRWYSDFNAVDIASEIKSVFPSNQAEPYDNVLVDESNKVVPIVNNGIISITPVRDLETGEQIKIYYQMENGKLILAGCLNDFNIVFNSQVSDTTKLVLNSNIEQGVEVEINVILAKCEG